MTNINLEKLTETTNFIRSKTQSIPFAGIILGSGLGELVNDVDISLSLPYSEIPNFPVSTVKGHGGRLIFGTLNGKEVVLLSGRFHYYEGYSMQEITFPVRVMKALGAGLLMVSNAAGGMNSNFKVGDLMLIRDHINLFPDHPLRGQNEDSIGPRFPDMSEPYDLSLVERAKKIAIAQNIQLYEGVYIGLQGPTFETRAEYRWLHTIGGDTVGMSTVPEVIVAIHSGMKVFGMSVITDIGIRDELNIITHEEVLEAAAVAAPKMAYVFKELLGEI